MCDRRHCRPTERGVQGKRQRPWPDVSAHMQLCHCARPALCPSLCICSVGSPFLLVQEPECQFFFRVVKL